MSTVIIGIGNRDRADDGAGPALVDRLAAAGLAGVRLAVAPGDMLSVLDLLDGASVAILVDAMKAGLEAGAVRRLDVSSSPFKGELSAFASSHVIGLGDAIELARTLGRLPPRVILYGVEARDFTPGHGLSGPVEAALVELEHKIREDCACTKPH